MEDQSITSKEWCIEKTVFKHLKSDNISLLLSDHFRKGVHEVWCGHINMNSWYGLKYFVKVILRTRKIKLTNKITNYFGRLSVMVSLLNSIILKVWNYYYRHPDKSKRHENFKIDTTIPTWYFIFFTVD